MANLPLAAMHRIAKKAGAQRIGEDAAELMIKKGEEYLSNVVTKAVELAQHAGRKTIRAEDIELATEGATAKKPEKQSTIPAVPPGKEAGAKEPPASSATVK